MKIHVLPGDSLVKDFSEIAIDGEIVVCRECVIEGDLNGKTLQEFWQTREKFISQTYRKNDYRKNVADEFRKLQNLPANSEVNLWFEYELFCQANMWFCLSLLQNQPVDIFRVAPFVRSEKDIWKGFGKLNKSDLQQCFAQRIKFSEPEIALGAELWQAYKNKNFDELKKLGETKSACFPKLKEVCQAEIEKQSRPLNTLRKIVSGGETDFKNVFQQFSEVEGVYGFGDLQVKNIYQEIV